MSLPRRVFITAEQYHEYIAVAAYFIYQHRMESESEYRDNGNADTDWFLGVWMIDAMLEAEGAVIVEPIS